MDNPPLIIEQTGEGVVSLILNRPAVHNAFNAELISQLQQALTTLENDDVRVVQIRANGRHFSAGADLHWMRQAKTLSRAANYQDAQALAQLLHRLYHFPKPTLAMVQGAAYGGALGLIAAADIAIAQQSSRFCLSEVALGLIPAVISPYLINSIGVRQARRFCLTAEVINAEQALALGLIHEHCPDQQLTATAARLTASLLANGPVAQQQVKQLLPTIQHQPIDTPLIDHTCQRIADLRVSTEAQEGITAFLEKRKPAWRTEA